jgi:antitoxin FitA
MPSILIRNVDDELKKRLRLRAAAHGRSMEDEVRTILREQLEEIPPRENLVDLAKRLFGKEGGVDLQIDPREPAREPPDFGK